MAGLVCFFFFNGSTIALLISWVVIRTRIYISGKFSEDTAAALWETACRRIGLPPHSLFLLISSLPLVSFPSSFSSKSILSSLVPLPSLLFSSSLFLPSFQDDIWGIPQEHGYKDLFWVATWRYLLSKYKDSFLPPFLSSLIHSFSKCLLKLLGQAPCKKKKMDLREFSICLGKAGSHKCIRHYIITRCH